MTITQGRPVGTATDETTPTIIRVPRRVSGRRPGTVSGRRADAGPTTLPAVGPAWFGAVMGTGILATLSQTARPDALAGFGDIAARVMLVVGWLALVGLTLAFAVRVVRRPGIWAASWHGPAQIPLWGMVSMGMLAVGAATNAVLPVWMPVATHTAHVADAVLFIVATVLGLATALGFTATLVRTDAGLPTTVWGLAIVPPMVSATVGAGLLPDVAGLPQKFLLVMLLLACFFLGLIVAGVVFAVCYIHHWKVAAPPLAASASAWIPLGVIGQSAAAAQSIAGKSTGLVTPGVAGTVQSLANAYGWTILALGVPMIAWAVVTTVRGFVGRMPFAPGWWSLTFPVGTLALGSHLLGVGSGHDWMTHAGVGFWLFLCCTWTLCAVASTRGLARQARRARAEAS